MIRPSAVLWDMDGTVCDTEPHWFAAERAFAADHGVEWTHEDALEVVGWGLEDAARLIAEKVGSDLSPAAIVERFGRHVAGELEREIVWRPGVRELFDDFARLGIPQLLVTMSYGYIAQPIIDALGFDGAVTGDQVDRPKPHPEPYLRAADQVGVAASSCLAIEDSPTGSASAVAAGCFTVVVPNVAAAVDGPGRLVLDSLAGVGSDDLIAHFSRRSAELSA